jgi:hypothetical protein
MIFKLKSKNDLFLPCSICDKIINFKNIEKHLSDSELWVSSNRNENKLIELTLTAHIKLPKLYCSSKCRIIGEL